MSETVRLMLSVAATEDMKVVSLDVKTAFLYGLIPITQFLYGLTDADMSKLCFVQTKQGHRFFYPNSLCASAVFSLPGTSAYLPILYPP